MAGFPQSNAPFQPGKGTMPASKIELSISCRKLKNRDLLSLSDPMCVILLKEKTGNAYHEIARTEIIKNSLNPDFIKKIVMDFLFEECQRLKFEIYDVDSSSKELSSHDFLGRMECTLGEIVACHGAQFKRPLVTNYGNYGEIFVISEELGTSKEIVKMQFCGKKLDKKDFFGKSDPFLVFYRCNEDNSFSAVHRTEVIKKTLNPTWYPFTLPIRLLCNGDYHRTIRVECYDWENDGTANDFIGEFTTNLNTLVKGPGLENEYQCLNSKKLKKKNYKNSGTINLLSVIVEQEQTFLDYIKGGTQLHFTVAIYFTCSNGDLNDTKSLHYNNPNYPNEYVMAIRAVGEIIQDYDSDKLFPALGFGARIPPHGKTSHEFFLTGNPTNPYCFGIDGILQAYQTTLNSVELFGPTLFSPVIKHVLNFAKTCCSGGSHYFVLLIITDGIINDMPQTVEAVVEASGFPMSIIIVGVGDANFDAMEELDADEKRLSTKGKFAERDIVQFVPFRKFIRPQNWQRNQYELAKEVLAEVPDQLLLYMRKRGIKANPPIPAAVPPESGLPTAPSPPLETSWRPVNTAAPVPSWHVSS